jgi:uncharacterized membrane protein
MDTERSRRGLAGLLLAAGLTHFLTPGFYDQLIPEWLPPSPRFWTNASGAVELVTGATLLHPRTSRIGGWAALGLFAGVYPGNIKDTIDHWPPTTARGLGSLVRLPVQFPLFAWAWRVAHA